LIIAGQGTLGLEIHEAVSDLDSIVIPIGGGGLISGIATAMKTLNPKIKIYGVVAENAPGMFNLFKHKTPQPRSTYMSIADGISVKTPSQVMYQDFIKNLVDDVVFISDDQIAESILFLLERAKTVVEGSGAISFAAMRAGGLKLGQKTCALLCGGNIDMNLMAEILDRGLTRSGRKARVGVVVDDRPGALHGLTKCFADQGANILDVVHDRMDPRLHIREALITFVVETKSEAHLELLQDALQRSGLAQRIISDPKS
jgi:threonine dehydratase